MRWPPAAPTGQEEEAHKDLTTELQTILRNSKVPYFIWGKLAEIGYTDPCDFADRWDDKKEVKAKAPDDLSFKDGQNGFDKESSLLASIRLGHAVEEAQLRMKHRSAVMTADPTKPQSAKAIVEAVDRRNLEAAYKGNSKNGRPPALENQVNDTGLGVQFKAIQGGDIGFMSVKQLVPFLPDPDLQVIREAMMIE